MTFHGQPQGRPIQFIVVEYKGLYAPSSWDACINTQFKGSHSRGLFCIAQTVCVKRCVVQGKGRYVHAPAFDHIPCFFHLRPGIGYEMLCKGAIRLAERPLPPPKGEEADRAMIEAVRAHGLGILEWSKGAETLRRRLAWLHKGLGAPWPDMGDEALIERIRARLADLPPEARQSVEEFIEFVRKRKGK